MDDVRIRIAIFSGWPGLSTILWGKSKKSLHVKEPAQSTSTRLPSAHRLFYIGRALNKKKKGEEKIVACWYIGRELKKEKRILSLVGISDAHCLASIATVCDGN